MRRLATAAFLLLLLPIASTRAAEPRVKKVIDVAPVWSGHPVGFALLTQKDRQFVGFYDARRRMTIASRTLDSDAWTFTVLPSNLGWDSHNYIEMTLDPDGHLHVAGNMHGHPLVYFRTTRPLDIHSLERIESMIGREESRCTYPRFMRGPADELIFTYRDGGSGNGNQIYNVYDTATRSWSRLLDQPLIDGRGQKSAYLHGPVRGPDGYFHLAWVWRETPACETNHNLCYARSKDLRTWETSAGEPLALPITFETAEVIDPVPPLGGMINGNVALGFDAQKRPIVSYHKFDDGGATQLFNARLEAGAWKRYQTSAWTYRWDFRGGGSIIFEIRVSRVSARSDGTLAQPFHHAKHGSGGWTLDPATLKPFATAPPPAARPKSLERAESHFPGMQVKWAGSGRYRLRWETLPANRDRPRKGRLPPPSMLRLYEFER